jgi:hypothetical protein
LLEALLTLQFVLALLGANPGNELAPAVHGASWPFVAPFRTLFSTAAADGVVLEIHTMVERCSCSSWAGGSR